MARMPRPLPACAALLALCLGLGACAGPAADTTTGHEQLGRARVVEQTRIPVYGYRVARSYPHDTTSYTEGLVIKDGHLYEGTGLYGQSKLRQIELETGRVVREQRLDPLYFGEGIALHDGRVHQLTYLANTGFIYAQADLAPAGTFRYLSQGWGLTSDGRSLLMSNGSSSIARLDPRTHAVERVIFVTDEVGPVGFLNELEYVDGRIYANVWQTDFIAIIDAETGRIIGWIDLTGLNPDPRALQYPFVLNGIAYNERTGRLVVTGKNWPRLYEIDLVPR